MLGITINGRAVKRDGGKKTGFPYMRDGKPLLAYPVGLCYKKAEVRIGSKT